MAKPPQSPRDQGSVQSLTERFARHRDDYHTGRYNETQVRREFIDPLFVALGWDVHNQAGYAEAYKDVIHEDAIKIGGATKAPDYCFRIGGARKFFLEAKKPSVDIAGQPGPAYQLRRYAWSAKLPLSILTDFEEFAVYDCRIRPKPTDKASAARTLYIRYDEYADRWDEIASIFSKEAVLQGSFDKYAAGRKKRGTAEVDAEFLREIEKWRDALARNIALRNPQLTGRELNFAVQRTIDRIIFLRICEDRGVETYASLQALINGTDTYARLMQMFRAADDRYNSGLFHFNAERDRAAAPDTLTPTLNIDDKPLKDIFRSLYYPQSPYEFAVLPADILGNVYEQFLGKVIHLTAGHRARVEEKPEVKKAGGVYYTPKYIVDYIVEHTVGKLLSPRITGIPEYPPSPRLRRAGRRTGLPKNPQSEIRNPQLSPRQVSKLRILDPACGSGSFLVGAYRKLLEYHRDWYVANDPGLSESAAVSPNSAVASPNSAAASPNSAAGLPSRRDSASDSDAVGQEPHRAKVSLPLKYAKQVYQGAGGQWFLTTAEKKRILLKNIYGVDIDPQAVEVTKLNLLLCALENENQTTLGQLNLIHERALPDLSSNIKCGNSLIGPDFYDPARRSLGEGGGQQLALFDEDARWKINAFDWPAEFPEIFKGKNPGFDAVIGNPPWGAQFADSERVYLLPRYTLAPTKTKDSYMYFVEKGLSLLKQNGDLGFIIPNTWLLINSAEKFRDRILSTDVRQIRDYGDGVFKKATVESCILILANSQDQNGQCRAVRLQKGSIIIDHVVDKKLWSDDEFSRIIIDINPCIQRLLGALEAKGESFKKQCSIIWGIKPYQVGYGTPPQTREMLKNRIYHATEKKGSEWKPLLVGGDVDRYRLRFPGNRFIKYGKWLMYPSNETYMVNPKILLRQTSDTLRACYDNRAYYCQNSLFIIRSNEIDLKYLLALLNSKLIGFAYRFKNPQRKKTFAEIKPSVIKNLPLYVPNLTNGRDKTAHDRMVSLVETMLDLHKQLSPTGQAAARAEHDKTLIQRQISATDEQIDKLVYELYGLTEEEIAIVEGVSHGKNRTRTRPRQV